MSIKSSYLDIDANNQRQVYRFVSRIVGNELSDISKPCYMPKLVGYRNELTNLLGYTRERGRSFQNQFSPKYARFGFLQDEFTRMILMGLVHYGAERNVDLTKLFYTLLTIKFYNSLLHRMFPRFCSDGLWTLTLNKISTKHLFRDKNGIAGGVIHITNSLFTIYRNRLLSDSLNEKDFIRIIEDCRNRIAQSVKSFAEKYYELQKQDAKGMVGAEDVEEVRDIQLVADKISMSMCTYRQIDSRALEEAIRRSGINRDVAGTMITSVSDVEYKNNIKFIIILMGRASNIKNVCSESGRNGLIRKIDGNIKIGNYSIKEQMLKLLYDTEFGYRLKSMHTKQIVVFFSQYLTLFLRNRIC